MGKPVFYCEQTIADHRRITHALFYQPKLCILDYGLQQNRSWLFYQNAPSYCKSECKPSALLDSYQKRRSLRCQLGMKRSFNATRGPRGSAFHFPVSGRTFIDCREQRTLVATLESEAIALVPRLCITGVNVAEGMSVPSAITGKGIVVVVVVVDATSNCYRQSSQARRWLQQHSKIPFHYVKLLARSLGHGSRCDIAPL